VGLRVPAVMAFLPLDPSDPPHVKLAHVLTALRYTQRQSSRLLGIELEQLPALLAGEFTPSYTTRLRASTLAEQCGILIQPLEWLKVRSDILVDLADPEKDHAADQIERNNRAKAKKNRK
jgi:hypothetical protein